MPPRGPIVVLSEHALCRRGTAELLRERGFRVAEATTHARVRGRDTVIVDLDHATADTQRLLAPIHKLGARLILLGAAARLAATAREGVGVETPDADVTALVAAVTGRPRPPSAELERQRKLWRAITPRQREVLRWLAVGRDNRAIARALGVGERTVKGHVTVLLLAFAADSRTELALIAHRAGLRPRA